MNNPSFLFFHYFNCTEKHIKVNMIQGTETITLKMSSARLSMVYISLQCIELIEINFELILKQMIRTGCGFYVSLYEKLGPHIPVIAILT